jgi:MFS family permease
VVNPATESKNPIAARIGTLVFATSSIQFANGFFGTFIALRVASEDFGATMDGLVLSSYFAGFTLGAFFSGRIIERFGHIRVYAAFAGTVIAATAVMPVLVEPGPWMVLRAAVGFGCAGLFVTTESWLNAKSGPAERGYVFSIYMVGTFIAIALGQLLIGRVELGSASPFNIIVVLFAAALVLVSTTRAEQPPTVAAPYLPYGQLARAAPVAVAGAAVSGLIGGAFYALVPVWMQDEGIERDTIGLFMLVAVLGGLAFQIPIGLLSDRFDRRIVLVGLCTGLAVAAVALVRLPHATLLILPVAALFGGLMSTLYPVSVAHAHDRMPADRVVSVSSHLILASGCGSVLGPLIGMSVLRRFDINGVFYLMAVAALLLAVLAVGRILTSAAPLHLERTFRILAPQPTPLAHDPAGTAPPGEA